MAGRDDAVISSTQRGTGQADGICMDDTTPTPSQRERRAPQRLLYTVDQLLGRSPIWLRRRADKLRLAGHLVGSVALCALSVWWVVPQHWFSGAVLIVFAPGRGVHVGDLPTVVFLGLAVRSVRSARRLLREA
ncbi:MAG: hypothetical protein KY460_15390 [Actinobacteria bacterium]|nr:hypothetical protein [Actinomycetota bacterium]